MSKTVIILTLATERTQELPATSEVAGTTMIVAGVLSNFAIRSLMSIVVTHVMVAHIVVAHVSLVVTTLVGYEYLWMCIIETSSVIVSIYCECPSTSLPCYGAIEVVQCHILVILPRSQHEAEVCVATIPPDAKHVAMTVQLIR